MKTAPRLRFVVLLVLLTLGVLAGGVVGNKKLSAQKEGPKKKKVPPKARVVDVLVANEDSHTITITGHASARAARTVMLASQVTGQVLAAHPALKPGGFIDKGQVLFEVDPADITLQLARQEADLARTRARIRQMKVQQKGARLAVSDARKALALTQKQLNRDETLAKRGHLSAAGTDRTRLELNQRVQALHAARNQQDLLPHQIAQARAELDGAEKAMEGTQLDLSRTTVSARFDLQVVETTVEQDSFVAAGQRALTVDDISAIELPVGVSADDLNWLIDAGAATPANRSEWSRLLVGRPAEVTRRSADGKDRVWKGQISRIAPGLSEVTRLVTLYVRVDAPMTSLPADEPLPLLPGMFCSVSIPGRSLSGVVVIPRKALQEDDIVFVADSDDKLERRKITMARVSGDDAVVTAGLSSGDRIVVSSIPDALTGDLLKIRSAPSEPIAVPVVSEL